MKKSILAIFVTSMIVAVLTSPVFAIGPFNGAEVSENDNFALLGSAVNNLRGDGPPMGFNSWILGISGNWIEWKIRDARFAKGIMNTALVPSLQDINPVFMSGEQNKNTWMYLSGETGSTHGTLWVFIYASMGANANSAVIATYVAAGFPEGAFYMYNLVK
jgi:hypothetical protein